MTVRAAVLISAIPLWFALFSLWFRRIAERFDFATADPARGVKRSVQWRRNP